MNFAIASGPCGRRLGFLTALQGHDDGVDPPAEDGADAHQFSAAYYRKVLDGVGYNLSQESPKIFAASIERVIDLK